MTSVTQAPTGGARARRIQRQRIEYATAAAQACGKLLGKKPVKVDAPGGGSRKSLKIDFEDGSTAIATRRHHPVRNKIESGVLRALNVGGAPVPQLLAYDGTWIVQEFLPGKRLSEVLSEADEAAGTALLGSAIDGLRRSQEAAQRAGVEKELPILGEGKAWLREFVETPGRIASFLGMPAPTLPLDEAAAALAVAQPHFVKWDARPGNAIVLQGESVAWFDWEHCGRRNRLDDLAWLLCDDYTPDWPDGEARLLEAHLESFAGGGPAVDDLVYLRLFGSFHSAVRLALIFEYKDDGPWWDADDCLAFDKVGVTREVALRHSRRGARWAAENPLSAPLVAWFEALGRRTEELG